MMSTAINYLAGLFGGVAMCIGATVARSSVDNPEWDAAPGYLITAHCVAASVCLLVIANKYKDASRADNERLG